MIMIFVILIYILFDTILYSLLKMSADAQEDFEPYEEEDEDDN